MVLVEKCLEYRFSFHRDDIRVTHYALNLYQKIDRYIVPTQVRSSWFTPARRTAGGVQWLFAEPLTVKCGFFMSRLRSLGMDNGSWLQVEPLNCER